LSSSFLSLLEKDFIFTRAVTRHFRAKMKRADSHSLVSSLARTKCAKVLSSLSRVCARVNKSVSLSRNLKFRTLSPTRKSPTHKERQTERERE
jgi:hypothetical protein